MYHLCIPAYQKSVYPFFSPKNPNLPLFPKTRSGPRHREFLEGPNFYLIVKKQVSITLNSRNKRVISYIAQIQAYGNKKKHRSFSQVDWEMSDPNF